ncbi:MAG: hypothetical protein ACRCZ0_06310 [Cetobacterium sp.]
MNDVMSTISKLIQAEVVLGKEEARIEYVNEIARLKNEVIRLKEEVKSATTIRKSDDGKYFNLKDFCRIQKDFLFIDENGMKQFLFQRKVLTKINDKYVPSDNQVNAVEIGGEIFVFYNYLRSILTMRSLLLIGEDDDITKFVRRYTDNKVLINEQLSNMVYVDYKQTSFEFRDCIGSTYLEDKFHNK